MRVLAAVSLGLVLTSAAAAGPIQVEIDAEGQPRDPFLVRITGHYASLHNGTSRHWKDALLRAGKRRFIPLGPVNPLLNMGVSVAIYHPEFIVERANSKKTPLLIRPVAFETVRPRTWRSFLATRSAFDNQGPRQSLAQVLGHFQFFLQFYLPAVDDGGSRMAVSDESLRAYLPLFDDLARFAETDAATVRRTHWGGLETKRDPAAARSIANSDLETRTDVRELLRRTYEWLSLPRDQRVVVRGYMESMRYGQRVGEQLMTPGDFEQVGTLLDRYQEDEAANREPESVASWINPENLVAYRVRVHSPVRQCANLRVTVDLTGVVQADLGDMTKQVNADFCRGASGNWGFGKT